MDKPIQRNGASNVKSDVVDLYKSETNNSSTHAFHFDTEEINQFCDFTDKILSLIHI